MAQSRTPKGLKRLLAGAGTRDEHASAETGNDEAKATPGVAERMGHWLAIYGGYLFLAGWTYTDSYFRVFGLSARWLDVGLEDTVARGFTVLFSKGVWLSLVYLAVLSVSLAIEFFGPPRRRSPATLVTLVLVLLSIPTYLIAKHAGIGQAQVDRGEATKLPTVVFKNAPCSYRGKLVYLHGGAMYVSELIEAEGGGACPISAAAASGEVPQLWVFQLDDVTNVKIVQYGKR